MEEKRCWLCGRNGADDPLDVHHIFGGANRAVATHAVARTAHISFFKTFFFIIKPSFGFCKYI